MTFDKERFRVEVDHWISTGQDRRHYEYITSRDPIFLDLGAYHGAWSEEMVRRYGGKSHMFEVVPTFIENLRTKFTQPNYHVYEFGLSNETKTLETGLENQTDAFSIFENESSDKVIIFLRKMSDFIKDSGIEKVDVCKINIEGGEYDLLEHMLEEHIHLLCDNILVQFHWVYPIDNFFERWIKIRQELEKTHERTFDSYFVWENWKRIR